MNGWMQYFSSTYDAKVKISKLIIIKYKLFKKIKDKHTLYLGFEISDELVLLVF